MQDIYWRRRSYPFAEMQSVYSTAPADWARGRCCDVSHKSLPHLFIFCFHLVLPLGNSLTLMNFDSTYWERQLNKGSDDYVVGNPWPKNVFPQEYLFIFNERYISYFITFLRVFALFTLSLEDCFGFVSRSQIHSKNL